MLTLSAPQVKSYTVTSGDTLSTIFKKMGIPLATMYRVLKADKNKTLSPLKSGETLRFSLNKKQQLEKLVVLKDISHSSIFTLKKGTYSLQEKAIPGYWRTHSVAGIIRGSFYHSAKAAGLSDRQIGNIARIFQRKVDFSRDIHQGDTFEAIIDQKYINGEKINQSEIKAIAITVNGQRYQAFRFDDGNYYDATGHSLDRRFMRYPFHFKPRISSSFNLHRRNPVTHRISPHYGVDLAVPVGTPVLATSDGVVVATRHQRYAGNYIIIRNGNQYSTRFLHLSKFLVKPGEKVHRGEKIALSGNTGRTTGPHLHYEFRIDKQPVNPITVKLPSAKSLEGPQRFQFLASVMTYENELAKIAIPLDRTQQVAETTASSQDKQTTRSSAIALRHRSADSSH